MDPKLIYKKDQRLEEIEDKIVEIFSEAIYSFIIRKKLLKRKISSDDGTGKENIDKSNE